MTTHRNKYSTLVNVILQRLEEDILSGALRPGDRLDEQRLATRFGASRTPVREALRHLAAAGLVEVRPRKGAVVAEIPIPRMIQMFEVMATLEGLCARLAARRMTGEERERLRAVHRECNRLYENGAPESNQYFALGTKFHDVIYAGAHNPFLQETVKNIRARVSAYRRHQLQQPGRIGAWCEEHDAILKAILEADADRADEMTRRHISIQGDVFVDFLTSLTTAEVMVGS